MNREFVRPALSISIIAARWRLILTIMAGAGLGLAAAWLVVPSTFQATIDVQVRPNLGGGRLNTSADASMESIALVQPNMLHAARLTLYGAALRDPSALGRTHCGRTANDVVVVCETTSTNRRAARASLNQLVATFIPIAVETQIRAFEDTIQEMRGQASELALKDVVLSREIQRLRASAPSNRRTLKLDIDRSQLHDQQSIRADITLRIASIRRQITGEPGSIRAMGRGAQTKVIARTVPLIEGTGIGSLIGLIAGLWISLMLTVPATANASEADRGREQGKRKKRRTSAAERREASQRAS